MEPVATGLAPVLTPLQGIRAVVFDVYGTLVISGSGDISLAEESDREAQIRAAFAACDAPIAADSPISVSELFHATIRTFQESRRAEGIEFPEVEIRDVWRCVVEHLIESGALAAGAFGAERIERLATEYEVRANAVWPMPGMRETLAALRGAGYVLGIVSNAQFYTLHMLEAFGGAPIERLGFAPAACVWSFREREGKPSTALYKKLLDQLAPDGIRAESCLFIGNDMRNDIAPAAAVGMRTALFAGDKRSLRLREGDPLCANACPDLVVTDLAQLAPHAGTLA